MERISEHISYDEATRSQVAARYNKPNVPDAKQLQAMKLTASQVFEPVRRWLGKPIVVSSFFRSKVVNTLTGGSESSQHCTGEAIDMQCEGRNAEMFEYIKSYLTFDQLIWEFGNDKEPAWVHVSYRAGGNRRQILRAVKKGYKTEYIRM